MNSANEDHLFVPRIEGFDPSFCDDGVILEIDGQAFSPLGNPCVDDKFEGDEIVGVNHNMTTVRTEGRQGWTDSNLAVSRISDTMAVDRKS